MSVDREELKKAVDMLPEDKLAILQRYVKMLQKSSLWGEEEARDTDLADPILRVLGCLSGKPLTARQIEEEIYGGESSDA